MTANRRLDDVAQTITAEQLQALLDEDARHERHQCQWRIVPSTTPASAPVYQCTLTWSDGVPCGTVAVRPEPYEARRYVPAPA